MIAEFAGFIIENLKMVVRLFMETSIDGISYDVLIVASAMIGIVLTSVIVKFRPSFRAPRPPRNGGTNSEKVET